MNKQPLIIWGIIWLFFAIGFAYFGLSGFILNASEKGFRATMCGSVGCSDREYLLSVLWLAGMVLIIYILPIGLFTYFFLKKKK